MGEGAAKHPILGDLFVIAFLLDVLLKSFLLEQLVLFQCTVVPWYATTYSGKWLLCGNSLS